MKKSPPHNKHNLHGTFIYMIITVSIALTGYKVTSNSRSIDFYLQNVYDPGFEPGLKYASADSGSATRLDCHHYASVTGLERDGDVGAPNFEHNAVHMMSMRRCFDPTSTPCDMNHTYGSSRTGEWSASAPEIDPRIGDCYPSVVHGPTARSAWGSPLPYPQVEYSLDKGGIPKDVYKRGYTIIIPSFKYTGIVLTTPYQPLISCSMTYFDTQSCVVYYRIECSVVLDSQLSSLDDYAPGLDSLKQRIVTVHLLLCHCPPGYTPGAAILIQLLRVVQICPVVEGVNTHVGPQHMATNIVLFNFFQNTTISEPIGRARITGPVWRLGGIHGHYAVVLQKGYEWNTAVPDRVVSGIASCMPTFSQVEYLPPNIGISILKCIWFNVEAYNMASTHKHLTPYSTLGTRCNEFTPQCTIAHVNTSQFSNYFYYHNRWCIYCYHLYTNSGIRTPPNELYLLMKRTPHLDNHRDSVTYFEYLLVHNLLFPTFQNTALSDLHWVTLTIGLCQRPDGILRCYAIAQSNSCVWYTTGPRRAADLSAVCKSTPSQVEYSSYDVVYNAPALFCPNEDGVVEFSIGLTDKQYLLVYELSTEYDMRNLADNANPNGDAGSMHPSGGQSRDIGGSELLYICDIKRIIIISITNREPLEWASCIHWTQYKVFRAAQIHNSKRANMILGDSQSLCIYVSAHLRVTILKTYFIIHIQSNRMQPAGRWNCSKDMGLTTIRLIYVEHTVRKKLCRRTIQPQTTARADDVNVYNGLNNDYGSEHPTTKGDIPNDYERSVCEHPHDKIDQAASRCGIYRILLLMGINGGIIQLQLKCTTLFKIMLVKCYFTHPFKQYNMRLQHSLKQSVRTYGLVSLTSGFWYISSLNEPKKGRYLSERIEDCIYKVYQKTTILVKPSMGETRSKVQWQMGHYVDDDLCTYLGGKTRKPTCRTTTRLN